MIKKLIVGRWCFQLPVEIRSFFSWSLSMKLDSFIQCFFCVADFQSSGTFLIKSLILMDMHSNGFMFDL